jgi:hypothetical protein
VHVFGCFFVSLRKKNSVEERNRVVFVLTFSVPHFWKKEKKKKRKCFFVSFVNVSKTKRAETETSELIDLFLIL